MMGAHVVRIGMCFTLVLAGCGELLSGDDDFEFSPNLAIRAAVSAEEPPTEASNTIPEVDRRFGYDGRNRLIQADDLVSGFEVPLGLRARGHSDGFIEFEIDASGRTLKEFYLGLDRRTRSRFSKRRYAIIEIGNGFEVRHTGSSLERLKLDARYAKAYIYISPTVARRNRLRIHEPPPVDAKAHARRFRNHTRAVHRPARMVAPPDRPKATSPTGDHRDSTGNASTEGYQAQPFEDANRRRSGLSQPARATAPKTSSPKGYWQHPPSSERNVAPLVRKWQIDNPGKEFLD